MSELRAEMVMDKGGMDCDGCSTPMWVGEVCTVFETVRGGENIEVRLCRVCVDGAESMMQERREEIRWNR